MKVTVTPEMISNNTRNTDIRDKLGEIDERKNKCYQEEKQEEILLNRSSNMRSHVLLGEMIILQPSVTGNFTLFVSVLRHLA